MVRTPVSTSTTTSHHGSDDDTTTDKSSPIIELTSTRTKTAKNLRGGKEGTIPAAGVRKDSDDDLAPLVHDDNGDYDDDDDDEEFPRRSGAKGANGYSKVALHPKTQKSHSHDDHDHHGAGPPGSASTVQMIINIVISFVGAGLLGQPHAFMESGWLLGALSLLCVSALNVYSMLLLPAVQEALLRAHPHETVASYSDLGRLVLGPLGEQAVIVCLGISQAGFATAYIIFIAANIHSITQHVSRFVICLACIPGLMGLVQFRELKSLSPFSLLANFANFCALFAVLFQDYESYDPHNDTIHAVKWDGFLGVIAVTIYSMEGAGMVISLKSSAKKPQQFSRLLGTTLAIISVFMAFFGAAGYWAFGNGTMAPITLNLTSHWSATFVKVALCLGLYLTYPVMMFPIWTIWETWEPRLGTDARARLLSRGGLVVASAAIAYSVPSFGKFLRLVGSSICTLLGFIFPCLFHIKAMGKDLSTLQYILDIVILLGGCLFGIMGTFQSMVAMLQGELEAE